MPLVRDEDWRNLVGPAWLVFDKRRIKVPFAVVRRAGDKLALRFQSNPALRRPLIVHLSTGAFHQDVELMSLPKIAGALGHVIISQLFPTSCWPDVYQENATTCGYD